MNTYIVLLRGVNVGGNNSLPMKELKAIMVESGFENVKTYIQSGNIVVDSAKNPGNDICSLIKSNFGFQPEVMALTTKEYELSVSNNPYQKFEGKFVHFYFCKEPPNIDIARINKLSSESESYKLIDNVFYLHAPDGIGRSKLVSNIETCLGVSSTGRNLNTINRLKEMVKHA